MRTLRKPLATIDGSAPLPAPGPAGETAGTVSGPVVGDGFRNLGMVTLRVPADDGAVRDSPVTVIVSGVGRSGTSMVAKVLHALGLPMGKTDGLEVFEDQEFIKALVSFDYNHMRQIISDYDAAHARWGFKFASLQNHVFPPQLAHFRNPRLIIVSRDLTAAAARSFVSDPDRKNIEETLLNVAKQISDMVDFVRNAECPALLVSYEKFIAFPDGAIDAIAQFCGIVVTDETRMRARRAVEPNNPNYIKLFHPSHRGNFDAVRDGVAIGWCAENGRDDPVPVELLADGAVVSAAVADIFRSDLLAAGIGSGRHGFRLDVACLADKPDAVLQIRTVGSGYLIFNSGRTLKDMSAS
jgi:hypothetical protein